MNLSIIDLLSGWGVSFMLVLTRVSAMIYAFPFFGSPAITVRVRIAITLVISFMLLPLVGVEGLGLDWNLGRLALGIGRELAIGLIVGFGTKFLFEAFSVAGTFAGRQMGFAMVELVDPVTSAPQSMVGGQPCSARAYSDLSPASFYSTGAASSVSKTWSGLVPLAFIL